MQDTIQTIIDSATTTTQTTTDGINTWMIIAIVELAVIIGLLVSRSKRNDKRAEIKRKVMEEGDVDFANIMNSSFNAERLYKELIRKCHPDRFAPDAERMAIANELSTLITKNKHNIKRLEALRNEAQNKLNINF